MQATFVFGGHQARSCSRFASVLKHTNRCYLCPSSHPHRREFVSHMCSSGATKSVSVAVNSAPKEPGVYVFRDGTAADSTVLYIGKAVSLRARLKTYLGPASSLTPRTGALVSDARRLDVIPTNSETAALALESALIAEHRPPFNVLLKDDRRHPFVVLTLSEGFPRLFLSRKPWLVRTGSESKKGSCDRVYGPFLNERRVRRVLRGIHDAYPLRQRANPLHANRPCLNFSMGTCLAPCQGRVSLEDYNKLTRQVDMILSGRARDVLKEVAVDLADSISQQLFEDAVVLRNRRDSLTTIFKEELQNSSDITLLEEARTVSSVMRPQDDHQHIDIAACATSKIGEGIVRVRGDGEFPKGISSVVVFQVRDGVVVNRLIFSAFGHVHDLRQRSLASCLTKHYVQARNGNEIPEEVFAVTPIADGDDRLFLETLLSRKRGKRVRIVQKKHRMKLLADIVLRNAEVETSLGVQLSSAIGEEIADLIAMLSPYFGRFRSGDIHMWRSLRRIECYDVSHLNGAHAVGSMSVLVDGQPDSREYRTFTIETDSSLLGSSNDGASLSEMIHRRFECSQGTSDGPVIPDLIVVDGGKGQVSAACKTLENRFEHGPIEVPVLGLAKCHEDVFVNGASEPLNKEGMRPGVRLLCRARDEAHRIALARHRGARGKASLASQLQDVPGLGKTKRDALLRYFPGGAAAVAVASVESLTSVPGIGPALARRIHNVYNTGAD